MESDPPRLAIAPSLTCAWAGGRGYADVSRLPYLAGHAPAR